MLGDVPIDEQRILTEAAIFADKIAVAEETVRLRSHFAQFGKMLESADPVGRKLDFLVQEMNREANTIGSKATDAEIAYMVVDIKAEIEKIGNRFKTLNKHNRGCKTERGLEANEVNQHWVWQYGFCKQTRCHCQPGVRPYQAHYSRREGTRYAD